MYVYEDPNFGGFRFTNGYVNAHKWLETCLNIKFGSLSNFAVAVRARMPKCSMKHAFLIAYSAWSVLLFSVKTRFSLLGDYFLQYQGKMVFNLKLNSCLRAIVSKILDYVLKIFSKST